MDKVGQSQSGDTNLETTVGSDMDLRVYPAAIFLDELVGMTGVAVHVVETNGGTAIGEHNGDLVSRLWVLYKVVL